MDNNVIFQNNLAKSKEITNEIDFLKSKHTQLTFFFASNPVHSLEVTSTTEDGNLQNLVRPKVDYFRDILQYVDHTAHTKK